MMYARIVDGSVSVALKGVAGVCPSCGKPMTPKCGDLKVHHWAHRGKRDCDPWFEGETAWHMGWKNIVRPECCEVVIGDHRADIATVGEFGNRLVVELQHSPIAPEVVRNREAFYGNMIWLFHATPFESQVLFRAKRRDGKTCIPGKRKTANIGGQTFDMGAGDPELSEASESEKSTLLTKADYHTFRWKNPRQSLWSVTRKMFWDFSDSSYFAGNELIFHVRKIHHEVPCGGWGVFMTKREFIDQWLSPALAVVEG